MGKTVPVDQLTEEVMKSLEEYADLTADVLKKEIQNAGKVAKRDCTMNCVKGKSTGG